MIGTAHLSDNSENWTYHDSNNILVGSAQCDKSIPGWRVYTKIGTVLNLSVDYNAPCIKKDGLLNDIAFREMLAKNKPSKTIITKNTLSKDTVSKDTVSKDRSPKKTVIKDTIDSMIAALNDPDKLVACRAAWALGESKNKRAIDPLFDELRKENWSVGMCATMALVKLAGIFTKDIVQTALTELKSPYWYARQRAVWIVGRLRYKPAVSSIIKSLEDEEDWVRDFSAWALGVIGDKNAIPALQRCFSNDKNEAVKHDAEKALALLQNQTKLPFVESNRPVWLLYAIVDIPLTGFASRITFPEKRTRLLNDDCFFGSLSPEPKDSLLGIDYTYPLFVIVKGRGIASIASVEVSINYFPSETLIGKK
jgi:hypothetical protein